MRLSRKASLVSATIGVYDMAKMWMLRGAGVSAMTKVYTPTESALGYYYSGMTFNANKPKLSLYKAAVQVKDGVALPTTDLLVEYKLNYDTQLVAAADGRDVKWDYQSVPKVLTLNQENSTLAIASGAAAFFVLWEDTGSMKSTAETRIPTNALWGTVGSMGSGADLELNDTNIQQGIEYFLKNCRIQVPAFINVTVPTP